MLNYYSWWVVGGWVGQKKTKLMLYSTLVEIEVGVELGKKHTIKFALSYSCKRDCLQEYANKFKIIRTIHILFDGLLNCHAQHQLGLQTIRHMLRKQQPYRGQPGNHVHGTWQG